MKISTTPSVIVRIVVWLLLLLGGAWLSIHFDLRYFPELFGKLSFHLFSLPLGLALLCLAFRAAAAGGRELARRGREGDLPRLETNRLVTTGIYACTRHPMLFGLMLLPEGVALLLGSPTFIFIVAPLEALFILAMILTLEEKEAAGKFGRAYLDYRKQTPLIPRNKACWQQLFGRQRKNAKHS
ncbi:isoprenylcysteine carboxylmethyltransferase family protein [Nitratifractor sp.]|uniref:methyltransferase family protein n=1 Tax=Nitratifractor sp. TaxID=2268144 RepID=UPI0025E09154|nr:isoprenylcysteine carboxylmethyltransferase family protein [Nitratifractor sp.]